MTLPYGDPGRLLSTIECEEMRSCHAALIDQHNNEIHDVADPRRRGQAAGSSKAIEESSPPYATKRSSATSWTGHRF